MLYTTLDHLNANMGASQETQFAQYLYFATTCPLFQIFKKLCAQILYRTIVVLNKYRTVEELRSTFSHIKSINILFYFSFFWFVNLCVDL